MTVARSAFGVVVLTAVVIAASSACQSASSGSSTPLGPATAQQAANDPAVGGSSLKASAPVAQSPANGATTSSLTPTLSVSGGGLTFSGGAVQFRFRIIDEVGTVAADSGLVSSATWTPSAPLTPTSRYTWTARSEYQGLSGPWSTTATFITPVAPGN